MSNSHVSGWVLTVLLSLATNFIVPGAVASPEEKIVSQKDCVADGVSVEASVKQPDYGHVTGLRLAANGEVYAIGDHRFYKVTLAATTDGVVLETSALPVLYRKSCGWFGTLFGTCQEENAIFSDAVSAVFLSGYIARGGFKSYVYGLTAEVLDLSSAPSPHYQRDCGMGFVVMVGESNVSIMDKSGDIQPYGTNVISLQL